MYKILWESEFDPIYPESGWGFKSSKSIYPLKGDIPGLIPDKAKGCYIDSSFFQPNTDRSYYSNVYSKVKQVSVKKGERYTASIYAYVPDDFDGEAVELRLDRNSIKNGVVSGKYLSFYNINKKNTWQKLEIEFDTQNGMVDIYIGIKRNKSKSFAQINGYVVFAYPQINSLGDDLRKDSIVKNTSVLDKKNIKLGNETIYNMSSLNDFTNLKSFAIKNEVDRGNDFIRNWVLKFISEDTTYYEYHAKINFYHDSTDFISGRTDRWLFAWLIFAKEYSWKEKVIGGGFDFLNWYGYYFLKDKTRSDYPHNPFLHVLLYSGIIGLSIYIYFLYNAFYYYLKYKRDYYIFFIFFLITFFFSFFSGGSPFDPPIMGFFVILPFFINSVYKKDEAVEYHNQEKMINKDC